MAVEHGLPQRFAPPPTFAVYGLLEPWERRSLDWICNAGRPGEGVRTYGLWLAHRSGDGRTGIRVGTFDWAQLEDFGAGTVDAIQASACHGVNALVDLTIPNPTVLSGRSNGTVVLNAVLANARRQIEQAASWPAATWQVDSEPTVARVWRFAGGWTGFAALAPQRSIVAVGIGEVPETLRLAAQPDTSAYGFDVDAPLNRIMPDAADRDWPETALRRPNRTGWHPDQAALAD